MTERETLRDKILAERDKGNVVVMVPSGLHVAPLGEFIKQPADGLLYDLNRLEEISLTFLDDPKWVNDFAVALVIRKLCQRISELEARAQAEDRVSVPREPTEAMTVAYIKAVDEYWHGVDAAMRNGTVGAAVCIGYRALIAAAESK